jgi:hypothetical protein
MMPLSVSPAIAFIESNLPLRSASMALDEQKEYRIAVCCSAVIFAVSA